MFGLFTTKIVAILAAISIASIGAWGGWQYLKLQKAESAAISMKAERDEAGVARDKAIEVNRKNEEVVAQLQQEKTDAQTSLRSLEARRKKDALTIGQLSDIIKGQASNPDNQVKLSPVLQAVIDQIQRTRADRVGAAK